jgi:hypothetical protein
MNKYTDEQLAIINSNEPVIIGEATAGSGKSMTAVGFAEKRKDKKILYCVFNSSMKKEAERDFKHLPNVTVKTTHGLAYAKFGNKYKNKLLKGNYRVADVIKDLRLGKKDFEFASQILDMYNFYIISDFITIEECIEVRYPHDIPFRRNLIKYVNKLWKKKEDINSGVGIEHNFYLKLYQLSKPDLGEEYEIVTLDECITGKHCVKTNKGDYRIKRLYEMYIKEEELPLIKSFNLEKEDYEYKKMTYAMESKNRDVFLLKTEGLNKIICTANHPVLTTRGYVKLQDLIVGEDIILLDSPEKQKTKMILNDDQYQMMIGSYLGDGHLNKRSKYNTYRIKFTQGEKQKEYLEMKSKVFGIDKIGNIKSGYTGKMSIWQSGNSNTFILDKNIDDCIRDMDERALAIWYMDDGSINTRKTHAVIHSNNFTKEENEILQQILFDNFGLECSIRKSREYYELTFNKENTKKLLKLTAKYMHKDLEYKNPYYTNPYEWNCEFKKYGGNVITCIEYVGKEDVYDIEVEGNHNFMSSISYNSTGIITHNCQDSGRIPIELFNNATCEQKLCLGDSRQQIYSWNGAKNALNRIEGVRYALSNSFRVGQRTAEICNYIYKEFLNEDLDMKGLNKNHNIYSHKSLDIHSKSGITVICRRNSTVLANALESAERGRRIYFIGGIRGYKLDLYRSAYYFMVTGKTKEPMLSKFSSWKEMVECADETDDVELNTLISIVKTYNKRIPDGVERIKEYTVNKMSEADIILTTAHKSKGLTIMGEGVVLEKDLINLCELKEAITSMAYSGDLENAMKHLESHREELNLLYVALTRSKTNLYLNDDIIQYLRD